jgi:NAD(P)-dependent dehydrogenase (short-subunit alcohol dehydrogenase family)
VRHVGLALTLEGMNDSISWFEAGHVALITGASQGFGRALAQRLAERGLSLVITARDGEALAQAATELRELTRVEAIAGDVAELEHVHRLVTRVSEAFGRLDLLVNNASTLGHVPLPALQNLSPVVFHRLFETNVFAPLHLIQHSLPLLIRARGTIVNVTSDAAVNAYPGWGGYGASKAALEHVSRTLAAEIDGFGVSVLVVDPGGMDTQMHRDAEPDADFAAMPSTDEIAGALLRAIATTREPFARIELPALLGAVAAS